ncbi:hypothetical protein ATE92_1387 [Ulvibacter sp. MAR_2010_11]|uniref:hypothetical protein n=1 Tax=Ulvibacter sp. MAR_2010_11 TaxID=1250229 RepID=UPI000C2CBAB9|nr:hypothetical protein [Ulvibacter sp. MAR_2010_11]PKA83237.1 hypothetical protein ATE92_1387 [Ulvibacter sp. MAR_2010_11]
MIRFAVIGFLLCCYGCGSGTQKPKENIIGPNNEEIIEPIQEVVIAPVIPPGAITANFNGDDDPFYAYVKGVNMEKGITRIAFEELPNFQLAIPETYGASLQSLQFPGFDRDVLLISAKLKDPAFTKYFVYVFRNNQWKQVVNGFAIHKSHLSDTLVPIRVDSTNNNNVLRYYSVFDLDNTNHQGYVWRLLTESIPILNR